MGYWFFVAEFAERKHGRRSDFLSLGFADSPGCQGFEKKIFELREGDLFARRVAVRGHHRHRGNSGYGIVFWPLASSVTIIWR